VGSTTLKILLNHTENIGTDKVYLHTQITAHNFYDKLGFTICPESFMNTDIPHKMTKIII